MTLIVPTAYRRNSIRERNEKKLAGPQPHPQLQCLRCFNGAIRGQRCEACRKIREIQNKRRKR